MPKINLTRSLENILLQDSIVPYKSSEQKQNEALAAIHSRFDVDEVLVIARILLSLRKHEIKHTSYHVCCVHHEYGAVAVMTWLCFTALHPDQAHQLDEIAAVVRGLAKHFGQSKNTTYAMLVKDGSWQQNIADRFSLSTLEPTWRVRRRLLESGVETLESLFAVLKPELGNVNPAFEHYIDVLKVGIEKIIASVQTEIEVLNRREMIMEDACQNRFEVDAPDLEMGPYYLRMYPPSYWPRWGTPVSFMVEKPTAQPPSGKDRIFFYWERFQRFLGYTMPMAIIMALFCTLGIAATTLAVYKCASPDYLPAIDSNFWSALAQSNIAIAAIYSIIVPQLQGQPHPIPPRWRWVFTSLLLLSVATTVVATCVYPWHVKTSIVAAFISSTSQLAVTLHMILASGRKIKNLQDEVEVLRSSTPRRSGRR